MGEAEVARVLNGLGEQTDPEVRRFLTESLGRIVAHFEPEALLLFGSRVENRADEWSDIDLIVVSRRFESVRLLERMRQFRTVARPHIRVDALCYTPDEFEYIRGQPSMVRRVMETGLRVI